LEGDSASITIKLVGNVVVSGFTLEHIHKYLSPFDDVSSAPKSFRAFGIDENGGWMYYVCMSIFVSSLLGA
jgi:hypothetical protein